MHNTNPSPSQQDPKQPSRFLGKKTVRRTDSVVRTPIEVLEAFFSSLPPTEVVYYIREINVTPLITALSAAPFELYRVIDDIPTGTSLLLTHIEQNFYDEDTSVFPATFQLIEPDSGDGLANPILFNIFSNNVSLLESGYAETNSVGTTTSSSGTTIRGRNILDFGQHKTGLFVLEDSTLTLKYTLFGNAVGTNIADYASVRLRGFKMPTKTLQEARLKFGF